MATPDQDTAVGGHPAIAKALWTHARSRNIGRACLLSSFVQGIAAGTLPAANFNAYVAQDAFFLNAFKRAYSSAAKLATELGDADVGTEYERLAAGVDGELGLHNTYAKELGINLATVEPLPATSAYVEFLEQAVNGDASPDMLVRIAASMAPCMRLYAWLGTTLSAGGARDTAGSYVKWVDEYSSEGFEGLAATLERLLDQAAAAQPDTCAVTAEACYLRAMELELAFFGAHADGPEVCSTVPAARKLLDVAKLIPPRVLIVAGSDSGGGAGIQADMKACSAHGVFSTMAIAALTAQNTLGVHGVFPIPTDFVAQQIQVVVDDIGTDVIKTGMLATSAVVTCVVGQLKRAREAALSRGASRPMLVVDPVMVSTSGHRLLEEDAVATLKAELLPMSTIITPNIPEAAWLLGVKGTIDDNLECMEKAARNLLALGPQWVLLKGGHGKDGSTESVDVLVGRGVDGAEQAALLLPAPRVQTTHTHGTGCTLGSSIAAGLAKGQTMPEAVRGAKEYVHGAIAASTGLQLGSGAQGPLNHSWRDVAW